MKPLHIKTALFGNALLGRQGLPTYDPYKDAVDPVRRGVFATAQHFVRTWHKEARGAVDES